MGIAISQSKCEGPRSRALGRNQTWGIGGQGVSLVKGRVSLDLSRGLGLNNGQRLVGRGPTDRETPLLPLSENSSSQAGLPKRCVEFPFLDACQN